MSALSFKFKGRCYYFLAADDPAFAKYSPSKVMMVHAIERTFQEKGIFCFGGGLYPYKLDWCQSVAEVKFPVLFFNPAARQLLGDALTFKTIGRFFQSS